MKTSATVPVVPAPIPTPADVRDLTRRIEALDREKYELPHAWLDEHFHGHHSFLDWALAEKATALRRREILDELKALRAERKAVILAIRTTREQRQASAKARKTSERAAITVECQICERRQCKDTFGRLVHHGYLRPGYGSIEGDCPGVGHHPYPATDELKRYLRSVTAAAIETETSIADLPARETIIKTVRSLRSYGSAKWEIVTVQKAEVDAHTWDREVEHLKWELESRQRQLRSEVVRVTRRIAAASTTSK